MITGPVFLRQVRAKSELCDVTPALNDNLLRKRKPDLETCYPSWIPTVSDTNAFGSRNMTWQYTPVENTFDTFNGYSDLLYYADGGFITELAVSSDSQENATKLLTLLEVCEVVQQITVIDSVAYQLISVIC